MDIVYSMRSLDRAVVEAYCRLLPHQQRDIEAGKLQWRYGGDRGQALIATAESEGTIVGMIGSIRVQLRVMDKTVPALQAVDGVVDPAARGKGCFGGMARTLHDAAVEQTIGAIYGFPNKSAAGTWFNRLGWARLGTAPFLFKPLRAGYFVRRLPGLSGVPLSFPQRSHADIRRIARFRDQDTGLWDRFAGATTCGIERTPDYLNWRLIESPCATYDCLGRYAGDELRSFVATRTMQKHGGRLGYIMEALGDDSLPDLLDDAAARMKADGVDAILAWCFPTSPNRKAFRKAGFLPLPKRFAPQINFGARAFAQVAEPATEPQNWYLSYLDSDTV